MPHHIHDPADIRPFLLGGRRLWFHFTTAERADGYAGWIEAMLPVFEEFIADGDSFELILEIAGDVFSDPLDPEFPPLVHIGDTLPADPAERVVPSGWPTSGGGDDVDDDLRTIVVHVEEPAPDRER